MLTSASRSTYAALCVCVGAILWGIVWYPMRLLEDAGLHGIWLALIVYVAALVASLPYTRRGLPALRRTPGWLAVLALAAGWTNIAFVQAVLGGNILRVLLLFYLSPLWATFLARVLLGERIPRAAAGSLALAVAGALLMLWNPALGVPWPEERADWFGLTAGMAFALSNVATRAVQQAPIATKLFCVFFGVSTMALAIIALADLPAPYVSAGTVAGAAALGVFGILVMTALIQYGVTHIPVHRSAVITFVELIAGAVSQALLTDEVVTLREWIGGALIAAGAYGAVRAAPPAKLPGAAGSTPR
ncbi:MAG TPA: DMT family transporter [Burkholderiales bacterium]